MPRKWVGLASLGLVAASLTGAAASANSLSEPVPAAPVAITRTVTHHTLAQTLLPLRQADDAVVVPAGTLDDGQDLLPQAAISLADAIAAAQAAVPGATAADIGEVDLEDFDGTLVFNVDVGDRDVKVDAATGAVLSADLDD